MATSHMCVSDIVVGGDGGDGAVCFHLSPLPFLYFSSLLLLAFSSFFPFSSFWIHDVFSQRWLKLHPCTIEDDLECQSPLWLPVEF